MSSPFTYPCLVCREEVRFTQGGTWVHTSDGTLIRFRPDGRDDHLVVPDRRSAETRRIVERHRGPLRADRWGLAFYEHRDAMAREDMTWARWVAGKASYAEVVRAREATASAWRELEAVEGA